MLEKFYKKYVFNWGIKHNFFLAKTYLRQSAFFETEEVTSFRQEKISIDRNKTLVGSWSAKRKL
jgi:hypothetical protein